MPKGQEQPVERQDSSATTPDDGPVDANFPRAKGQRYLAFMDGLHEHLLVDWYLEVGCRAGRSFAPSRSKTIAVDPFFKAEMNIIGAKPQLHVFQQTSDDFFASGFLARNDIKLSYSFLDGMHLFEYLLRDFMNTEANSRPEGVIAMHDCCPFSHKMLTRDLDNLPRGPWTGDVWKLIPILKEYRPDLSVTVLGCRPTGLVLVSGLNPADTTLRDHYDEILARFATLEIDAFGLDRFAGLFDYVDPETFAAEGYPLFRGVNLNAADALRPTRVTK